MATTVRIQLCTQITPSVVKRQQAGHQVKLSVTGMNQWTDVKLTDSTGVTGYWSTLANAIYDVWVCGAVRGTINLGGGTITKNFISPCPDVLQKMIVRGQLFQRCPGEPLRAVLEVSICRPPRHRCAYRTMTDADGSFEIAAVNRGIFTICVNGNPWRLCGLRESTKPHEGYLMVKVRVCPPKCIKAPPTVKPRAKKA
jgi:hypothetical protein